MELINNLRCIACLLKCSKYIYYIKKALCIVTLMVIAVTVVSFGMENKKAVAARLKELL